MNFPNVVTRLHLLAICPSYVSVIAAEKGVVIAAGIWGKLKTVVQMVMVCFLIGNLGGKVIFVIEQVLIYAALVLTIISLIDYLVSNKNVLKD